MDGQPAAAAANGSAETNSDTGNSRNNSQSTRASSNPRRNRDFPISSATAAEVRSANHASNPPLQSAASSLTASPLTSREPSPTRPALRTGAANSASTGTATGARSRKNGQQQDPSPTRLARSTIPTSTTSTRTLTASSTPVLLPAATVGGSDTGIKAPVARKSSLAADPTRDAPRWPVSPRLRSPPPVLNKLPLGPPRRGDQDPPAVSAQRSTPSPQPGGSDQAPSDTDPDESHLPLPGVRTPVWGASSSTGGITLETVQEASPLASPQGLDDALERLERSAAAASENGTQPSAGDVPLTRTLHTKTSSLTPNESGSDSGSNRPDRRPAAAATSAPPPLQSRQSSASMKPSGGGAKGKPPGEGTAPTMTVETETVTSVPQVSLAPKVSNDVQGSNGTLRTKPSTETIRPKKEKKKPPRKQPAVSAGTASSKADIFEAKVASAVDEANTSDSDETFVYDSNPPDGGDRPRHFHSRTPSATSMASQVDRSGMRSIHSVMEGAAGAGPSGVAVKKNMKFVNNTFNGSGNDSGVGDDESKGTARSNAAASGRGTARHYHHFGRWGRNGGNGHPSLFDNESFFPAAAARSKLSGGANNSRQSSGPPSPRFAANGRMGTNGKRGVHVASYDMDDTTGADDERTPLINPSVRSARSTRRGSQMAGTTLRSLEQQQQQQQSYRQNPSFLNRFASCLVLTVMLLLVVSGAIGFMFLTTQPLTEISLVGIRNVVPSEQELMFDVVVRAHNPNVVVVVIDSADLEVFAKSPHAGSDSEWWRRPHDHGNRGPGKGSNEPGSVGPFTARRNRITSMNGGGGGGGGGGVAALDDPANDPPLDDSGPIMRLGSIREFDSPLSFEGSFFHQGISASPGAVRLEKPGNGTESGTERWERILEDEFELILKGVLTYSLPLSQRVRSVPISGRTTVKPNQVDEPVVPPNEMDHHVAVIVQE